MIHYRLGIFSDGEWCNTTSTIQFKGSHIIVALYSNYYNLYDCLESNVDLVVIAFQQVPVHKQRACTVYVKNS